MAKLAERELVCAEVLVGKGRSVRSIAADLGVDESTLRYRLKRRRDGAKDGRAQQPEAAAIVADVIEAWIANQDWSAEGRERPEAVRVLYERLVHEHGFSGSYKSVLRFVRRRAPKPSIRPVRRIETRPGAQAQVDWATRKVFVHELGGETPLQFFLMTLSHARLSPVRCYLDASQLAWLDAHNHALRCLGGVPLTVRIDNLKTGVKRGAGPWAELNETYLAYANELGFIIDPARAGRGSDKGKVERRVQDVTGALLRSGERFVTLSDLNEALAERVIARAKRLRNPVTGGSVFDAWRAERELLQPLPEPLPEPFDVQVTREVGRDALLSFEGRQYAAPYPLIGRKVQVRGGSSVRIIAKGQIVYTYPRHTESRVLIDRDCYERESECVRAALRALYGDDTQRAAAARVQAPTPLGRIARGIVAQKSWEAATRPLSAYEALIRSDA